MNDFNYLVLIAGGEYDNVWDKEVIVPAPSISQALGIVEEHLLCDSAVTAIEQWGEPLTGTETLLRPIQVEPFYSEADHVDRII